MLYRTQVTQIGKFATESLNENMMIIFNDNAPKDVADYCFIHPDAELNGEILVGGQFLLGAISYPITAVGCVVSHNLDALGHITIRFDGASEAEYPGTVHVNGTCPKALEIGTEIIFTSNH
ncbi:TPA: PTS glucitol/sorbitol transporter subunit IIA [Aeromonas salmonicida subsp. smithia]